MSEMTIKLYLERDFFDIVFISNIWRWPQWRGIYKIILDSIKDTPCVYISEANVAVENVWTFEPVNWVAKFYKSKKHSWDGYPIAMAMLKENIGKAEQKDIDVFFAGTSVTIPRRKLYLATLQKAGFKHVYNDHLPGTYAQYLAMMRRAWICPVLPSLQPYVSRDIEAAGQYSVALLPDVRDEIEFRDGFTDGVNAVFYDSVDDLMEKIGDLLPDEDRMKTIAQAGYEHVLNHHLVEHQVDYVMGIVEPLLQT